jgi:putative FmdB family regulatory protein
MPLYEYVCPKCKSRFELLRRMNQADEAVLCPCCNSEAEKVLSSFACFSMDDSGLSSPVGGNSCSSCSTNSCGSCGV